MADQYGWPDVTDVANKLTATAPDGVTAELLADVPDLLAAVVAEFQSPVGRRGDGGTGRSFTPAVDARTYDGNGYPQLVVDDIVPGTLTRVTVYDATLIDVLLKEPHPGLGWNTLARPQGAGSILGASYATPGIFPLGLQNVTVYATFGYAAAVPADVWEAVRGEVARRAIIQSQVGVVGVGEIVTIGNFSYNSAAGVSVWARTGSLAVLEDTYTRCLTRYRDAGKWRRKGVARRMS